MDKSIIIFLGLLIIVLSICLSSINLFYAKAIAYFENKEDRKQQLSIISPFKCNKINTYVNGLGLDIFPPFVGADITTTVTEDNSYANTVTWNGGATMVPNL